MIAIKRFVFLAVVAVVVLIGPFFFGYHFTTIKDVSLEYLNKAARSRNFHLILPATGPNQNFCKLILSAAITGFPEPIFIGWEGHGMYNGTESHLFKITETLTYLHSLPASADNDLVLILDAYDIWLQLRPEVMLGRYFEVLKKNDARLESEGILGQTHAGAVVKNTIVFGPDKIHWPQHKEDPAVWAVPESSLPQNAFGPDTDTDMFTARPRWLNSGTIIGPVKDMRDMFSATVDILSRKFNASYEFRTSDQYYFAELWGEQEIGRMRLRDGENFDTEPELPEGGIGTVPDIPAGKRTEFHICLDYHTDMFQTAAAYDHHLTWMRYNQSETHPDLRTKDGDAAPQTADGLGRELRIDEWRLEDDVLKSRGPFEAADTPDTGTLDGWKQVMLGTNVVTQTTFPLFHVTGDKSLRNRWWPRMWFHPYSEQLLMDTKRKQAAQEDPLLFATVNGVKWRGAVPPKVSDHEQTPVADEKGGGWTDDGHYVSWTQMCGRFEDKHLFVEPHWAGKVLPDDMIPEGN